MSTDAQKHSSQQIKTEQRVEPKQKRDNKNKNPIDILKYNIKKMRQKRKKSKKQKIDKLIYLVPGIPVKMVSGGLPSLGKRR